MQAGGFVQAHPGVVAGGNFLGAQAHGVVQKSLELDFGVAQDVGVGRAAGLVFAQELGEHAVFVVGGKVDMLDLDAQHVGHGGGIDKVDVGRAELAVVVIFPVLHEDADDLVALLLEQVRRHGRVHPAAEPDHDALFVSRLHDGDYPCHAAVRFAPAQPLRAASTRSTITPAWPRLFMGSQKPASCSRVTCLLICGCSASRSISGRCCLSASRQMS